MRGHRRRGPGTTWRCVLGAGLLLGGSPSCSTPVTPGDAGVVTGGASPATLDRPQSSPGGLVELARVRMAGETLTARLFGQTDPSLLDGTTLVLSSAGFAWPPDHAIRTAYAALPSGPTLSGEETLRCELHLGPQRLPWNIPGIHVDVGPEVLLSGSQGAVKLGLYRSPGQRGTDFARVLRYQTMETARVSADGWSAVNWSSGSTLTISFPGAPLPAERAYGAIPATVTLGSPLPLPLSLTEGTASTLGVAVGGTPLALPARDPISGAVLSAAPQPALPSSGEGLEVLWPAPTTPQTLVLSLELYGAGSGTCPGDCGSSSTCCLTNTSCPTGSLCESVGDTAPACYPKDGDLAARLGALVCTAADTGQTTLPGDAIADLLSRFASSEVRGAILRMGRVNVVESTLADAIASDGTRHSLKPVLLRAADVVITRLSLPTSKAGGL